MPDEQQQQQNEQPSPSSATNDQNEQLEESARATTEFIKLRSEVAERLLAEIITHYSGQLDEFVATVEGYLAEIKAAAEQGEKIEYSDHALEMQIIKLPVLMYWAGSAQEDMALRSAVAQAHYMEVFNNAHRTAIGTIPDKQRQAEMGAMIQQMAAEIQKAVHKKLKMKVEMADKLYEALKKVVSKRITMIERQRGDSARMPGYGDAPRNY